GEVLTQVTPDPLENSFKTVSVGRGQRGTATARSESRLVQNQLSPRPEYCGAPLWRPCDTQPVFPSSFRPGPGLGPTYQRNSQVSRHLRARRSRRPRVGTSGPPSRSPERRLSAVSNPDGKNLCYRSP